LVFEFIKKLLCFHQLHRAPDPFKTDCSIRGGFATGAAEAFPAALTVKLARVSHVSVAVFSIAKSCAAAALACHGRTGLSRRWERGRAATPVAGATFDHAPITNWLIVVR